MFIAIVLDTASTLQLRARAIKLQLVTEGADWKCHHVTLAMGAKVEKFNIGAERELTVTHSGFTQGRVSAFAVMGAPDSENKIAHVTVATFNGAKPRESNDIAKWVPIPEPFTIRGIVKICE